MIEKLDMVQSKAASFESEKRGKDVMVIAIITIGRAFVPETNESHKEKAKQNGISPKSIRAKDDSKYFEHYVLTRNKEPINVTEYSSRLASGPSTHVIQLSDCESSSATASAFDYDPDWKSQFHEIVL